ncbi:MarP family serine protease [Microbacterium koreense]|uniref:MarP family serine protease n=1 Tax=Microbacterium koreense TaxID=323761 RepID=A0ABW2ZR56_9MICO
MILVDVLVVVVLLVALIAGVQRGFFASIGTLAGLAAGGFAAFWLTPLVSAWVPSQAWRAAAVLATAAGLLLLGAGIGAAIGSALRSGTDRLKLRGIERFLGGVASVVAAGLAIVLVAPAVAGIGIPGVSTAISSSQAVRTLDWLTPDPVDTALAELRGHVIDEGIPRLGNLLGPGGTTPTAPVELDDPDLQRAAASVARVSGTAFSCGRSATGSGFVIAPDRVVTNAHVVAGVDTPIVELPGAAAREGRIVYFDPVDDLAVIAVDDLGAAVIPQASTMTPGQSGAVHGYPLGGPFTSITAGILSVGTVPVADIYDSGVTPREIYSLQAAVRPGNSGGPLLTADGAVAGVVFARADGDDGRGYAVTMAELAPVADAAPTLSATVASGACID